MVLPEELAIINIFILLKSDGFLPKWANAILKNEILVGQKFYTEMTRSKLFFLTYISCSSVQMWVTSLT